MSRIGKKPIQISDKVEVTLNKDSVSVKGPKGTLSQALNPAVNVQVNDGVLTVSVDSDDRKVIALQGMTRALINIGLFLTQCQPREVLGLLSSDSMKSLILPT